MPRFNRTPNPSTDILAARASAEFTMNESAESAIATMQIIGGMLATIAFGAVALWLMIRLVFG